MAEPWAARFYNGKAWRALRGRLIAERNYICEECGGNFALEPSRLVGHHKKELTPENITDINISLNPANIKIICKECHDKEHERFAYGGGRRTVYLVYGAPCSGKSSWINQMMERGDLRIDLDEIFECLSGCMLYDHPKNLNRQAFAVRDLLLDQVYMRAGSWQTVFVAGGYPRKMQREQLAAKLGAELVYIETTPEEAKARAMQSRGTMGQEWCGYIDKWFREFEP